MTMRNNNPMPQHRKEDEIDFRQLALSMRSKWYYFLISVAVFGCIAIGYIKLTQPVFEAHTSVLIKDTKNSSKNIEDILSGDLFGNSKSVATEIGILRSRSVLKAAADELGLGISYFNEDFLLRKPLYNSAPFHVTKIALSDELKNASFKLEPKEPNRFLLTLDSDHSEAEDFSYSAVHSFSDTISTPYFTLLIEEATASDTKPLGSKYSFTLNSDAALYSYYSENLKTEALNKDATIIEITLRDEVKERAKDFLNALGRAYINQDVKDKSSVAGLTLKFVDEQLDEISKTLNSTEQALQQFKEQKGTVNLSEESKAYLERVTAVDADRARTELEIKSLDNLYNYVSGNRNLEQLAPSSLGTPDPLLIELITQLKQLQTKRMALLSGSSEQSPVVRSIDLQIEETKNSLIENIKSLRNQASVNLSALTVQLAGYENSIRKIPNIERELLGIQRNFSVNENIYLYLLQKKAETNIAKATAVSDNKVLDVAEVNDVPVVPNKKGIALLALLLGITIPVIIITLQSYVKNTISNREDVEKMTKVPIIGVVGHHSSTERMVVSGKPKSAIAEAFRSIRANLMFFGLADQHKTVLITSSVGGEGKSFTTLNLAAVLALQHYKVIVVGMDLRKPQLFQDLGINNDNGVSNFLIGQASLENVIHSTKIPGLDFIPAGPIPPNPAELLAKKEVRDMMDKLRTQYDYIIIDTPPVGIVSDALTLMNLADVTVFVVRENYSKKTYLKTINELHSSGKAGNMCLLLNDAGTHLRYGYGYGYGYQGYGYYDEDKRQRRKVFPKIFSKN
ncbi:MAG: hypothetical protein RIQ47_125 [Bacteroidota bacterium]|jgi:tyrosine-protein kinase Etk/Wzc